MIGSTGNSDGGVDIVVARYNSDGSLDDTFDSDGYATTNPDSLGLSANDANAITVLPDGKFLVAGWTAFADDGGLDVSLWKFSSNGSLDTSFGISGYISFDVNLGASDESEEFANSIAVDAAGNYIMGGRSVDGSYSVLPAIWKLLPSGALDTSFDDDGYYVYSDEFVRCDSCQLMVEDDGQYVLSMDYTQSDYSATMPALMRFNNEYQIAALPAGLEVEYEEINIEEGGANGAFGSVLLRLLHGGLPLAEMQVDMTEDQDWSAVSGASDLASLKSFVHNILNAGGAGANYSLFVPKSTAHSSVGICPGATALGQVDLNCSGLQSLTSSSGSVTVVDVGGQDYWRVSGLTGTGGFSFIAAAGGSLPATGSNQTLLMVVASGLLFLGVAILKSSHIFDHWRQAGVVVKDD